MFDPFAGFQFAPEGPAEDHFLITADADNDLPMKPRQVRCETGGTIMLATAAGDALPYTMAAGEVLHLRPARCLAISDGGIFYGLT